MQEFGNRRQKLKADESDEFNETAAWSIVWKAICNSGYHSEEEFEKLPPIIQRAVHSPLQLREWALLENMDGKAITVLQSDFQRAFRTEQKKEKERSRLSADLLKIMDTNSLKIEGGGRIDAKEK